MPRTTRDAQGNSSNSLFSQSMSQAADGIRAIGCPCETGTSGAGDLSGNGSEFIGMTAIELVCQLFGDTARCQPYKPEEKPHVERFNGTLRTYILTLPGTTTSSITRDKREPQKNEKLLTLEELRGKIYRFVYDRYALQVNELRSIRSGKAVAPMDIVLQMKATFTEPVPVSREEFESSLCFKRDSRALGHDGIGFDGWHYHSDELASLYKQSGGGKYEFLYSDLDATTIYVKPPAGGERIAAFEKDLEGNGIDRASAKAIRLQILAEGKVLDRRTFEHKLAEFRELQKSTKSSRSRAKTARVNDILDAAEEHQRRTMSTRNSTGLSAMLAILMAVGRAARVAEKCELSDVRGTCHVATINRRPTGH